MQTWGLNSLKVFDIRYTDCFAKTTPSCHHILLSDSQQCAIFIRGHVPTWIKYWSLFNNLLSFKEKLFWPASHAWAALPLKLPPAFTLDHQIHHPGTPLRLPFKRQPRLINPQSGHNDTREERLTCSERICQRIPSFPVFTSTFSIFWAQNQRDFTLTWCVRAGHWRIKKRKKKRKKTAYVLMTSRMRQFSLLNHWEQQERTSSSVDFLRNSLWLLNRNCFKFNAVQQCSGLPCSMEVGGLIPQGAPLWSMEVLPIICAWISLQKLWLPERRHITLICCAHLATDVNCDHVWDASLFCVTLWQSVDVTLYL